MIQPQRSQNEYKDLKRSVSKNHMRAARSEMKKREPTHTGSDFGNWLGWIMTYLKNRFGPNHKYPKFSTDSPGVYRMEGGSVIGIASDWATATREAFDIADKIRGENPHYTVHVGDTYFVGDETEIAANFLGDDSPWPRGSVGSFALLGNHEMYARGDSYFEDLLPVLSVEDLGKSYKQLYPFFCLENDHWRILGLDTGYHSVGLPILELLYANCRLPKMLMEWLKTVVRLNDPADKRGLLILTHHQYITAFDGEHEYPKAAEQLAELIGKDRPVLWLWGHEHKFSMFQKFQSGDGITAYGRCIGHGGMPVQLSAKNYNIKEGHNGSDRLVWHDHRHKPGQDDLGYNGYVVVRTEGADLRVQYLDAEKKLIEEVWHHEASGEISGRLSFVDQDLGKGTKSWDDLYK